MQKFLAYSKSRMGMKKKGDLLLDVKMKSTLSPCEDNSVAAFTMHPSTRTTRTCRKREASKGQTEEEQNKRKEREKGRKEPVSQEKLWMRVWEWIWM